MLFGLFHILTTIFCSELRIVSPSNLMVSPAADLDEDIDSSSVLSSVDIKPFADFREELDGLSKKLGENSFGRAAVLNPSIFKTMICCYPDVPYATPPDEYQIFANLTTVPVRLSN
jgi:hypothetical protein